MRTPPYLPTEPTNGIKNEMEIELELKLEEKSGLERKRIEQST